MPCDAKEIKACRKRLRISQAALARKLRCTAHSVYRWEAGLRAPSEKMLAKVIELASKAEQ